MSDEIIFSCIIPASKKDSESQNLKDLIASIKAQDFPQDKIEILVITEGDSEQAKAIGIRRAKGEICAMFCADNVVVYDSVFRWIYTLFSKHEITGIYTKWYARNSKDNSLNRYFSLIGCNDPLSFYLGKADRKPHYEGDDETVLEMVQFKDSVPSLGDNGFFYLRRHLLEANLDDYYPMDCAEDLRRKGRNIYIRWANGVIWHRTTNGNLIEFLIRRYRYAKELYCQRADRRWRMLDTREDYLRLGFFILATLTVIQPIMVSIRGFLKVRDWAWAWHYPVCLGFLITYGVLALRTFCVRLLSQRWGDLNPLRPLSKA